MEIKSKFLISEILKRPTLWDKKNKNYHNRIVVGKQWDIIGAVMKQHKDHLKKKWKNLRDQFRNELRKIPISKLNDPCTSEAEYLNYTTWPHFKPMLFLKDQMKVRKPRSDSNSACVEESILKSENWDEENSVCIEDSILESDSMDDETNVASFTDFEDVTTDKPLRKKMKIGFDESEEILALEQQKLELLERKSKNEYQRDDDQCFFDSLLPYVKKLDMNTKLRCRIDIQNIVYNYVFPSAGKSASTKYQFNSSACNSCSIGVNPASNQPSKYATKTLPMNPLSLEVGTNAVDASDSQNVFNMQQDVEYKRPYDSLDVMTAAAATETNEDIFPN